MWPVARSTYRTTTSLPLLKVVKPAIGVRDMRKRLLVGDPNSSSGSLAPGISPNSPSVGRAGIFISSPEPKGKEFLTASPTENSGSLTIKYHPKNAMSRIERIAIKIIKSFFSIISKLLHANVPRLMIGLDYHQQFHI